MSPRKLDEKLEIPQSRKTLVKRALYSRFCIWHPNASTTPIAVVDKSIQTNPLMALFWLGFDFYGRIQKC